MSNKSAAKKAEERRISQVGDFKARMGGIQELPSGLVVKVRNPGGLQAFMVGGQIPNTLMPMIKRALEGGQSLDPKEMLGEDGEVDPKLFAAMEEMLDSVALRCIVDPAIHPKPESEEARSDEELYVDEIPMEDKQFLMQWVSGGTRDLEKFRQQQQSGLESVAKVQVDVRAAQRAAGLDPR